MTPHQCRLEDRRYNHTGRSAKHWIRPTNFPITVWFWYKVPAMKSRFYKVGVATPLLFLAGGAILDTQGGNR
jgi:hypothetical protein